MTVEVPAKLNLYLKVLGKRKDGYHNIETVFERIALFDRIVLRSLKNGKIKIFSDHPEVPVGRAGLVYKTINLLREKLRVSEGAEVKIFKRIPVAAGLGGGSSDAASILMGLNKLWKLSLKMPVLVELGKTLGGDVPFFLKRCSFAAAKGRGDEITPLGWKAKFWHLVISPPLKLLSKDIYTEYRRKGRLSATANSITNDLEGAVLKKAPVVARLKGALRNMGLTHSLVSGSGPSVFSLFRKRKEAMRAKKLLIERFPIVKDKGWQIFIVSTL